jgi:hypothetical protein
MTILHPAGFRNQIGILRYCRSVHKSASPQVYDTLQPCRIIGIGGATRRNLIALAAGSDRRRHKIADSRRCRQRFSFGIIAHADSDVNKAGAIRRSVPIVEKIGQICKGGIDISVGAHAIAIKSRNIVAWIADLANTV